MARSYWTMYYQASGGSWVADGQIPRPNANWEQNWNSNQTTIILADGDRGYVTPETRYLRSALVFLWYYDDGTYRTKIMNYITNHEYLKIVDHNSNNYIGRFVNLKSVHLIGITDTWDLEATFELMA